MLQLRTRRQQKKVATKTLLFAGTVLRVIAAVAVIFMIFYASIAAVVGSSQREQAKARHAIVKTMSGQTPDDVKLVAHTLLTLESQGLSTAIEDADDTSSTVARAVQEARATGAIPSVLTQEPKPQAGWLSMYWKYGLELLALIVALLVTGSYVQTSYANGRYLADLDWRLVRTYSFLVLVLPLGWPLLIVSAIRLAARPKEESQEPVPPAQNQEEFPNTGRLVTEPIDWPWPNDEDDQEESSRAPVQFAHAPIAAKHRYIELRTGAYLEVAHREENRLNDDIKHHEQRLREYGEKIQKTQRRLGEERAQHAKLVAMREVTDDTISEALVAGEFDRLMQLRGVKAVRLINNTLSLLVEPVIVRKGIGYDIGSWELRVGEGSYTLESKELRTGVRKSWERKHGRGEYPDYRYPDENRFCFGSRQSEIDDNVMKGQFLQAIELAIDCLHSTNPGEKGEIPDVFRKAKPEEDRCLLVTGVV